jgi:hypothetical protein
MKEKLLKLKEKIKWVFSDGDGDDTEELGKEKKEEKKIAKPRYIKREEAINIADKECNLKRSIYKDARMRGEKYGIVEIYDYYATLVMYNKKYAWYVKVMDGKYGYKQEGGILYR